MLRVACDQQPSLRASIDRNVSCSRSEAISQPPNHEQGSLGDREVFLAPLLILRIGRRTAESSSGELVDKKIKGGNLAVPGNDEIRPGVSGRLTRAARDPWDTPAIAQFLGLGDGLIAKLRMSRPDRARDAIDRVAAPVDAAVGIVEHAIFGPELVDGRAPARGVAFTEDVAKIADQQRRYAVGHGLSPFGIEWGLRYLDPEWLYCSDLICTVRPTTFPLYFGSHAFR
jgi:hypothetical protein